MTPIIAFSKDWTGDHTSNHHVLRELAKTRRVVWINSIGTRAPKLGSARDLGTIRRKLTELAKGAVNVENDLWVVTPLVVPMAKSPALRAFNRWLIKTFIRLVRARLGIHDFHLWTFLPNAAGFLGMGESLAVYYCVDEWSLFEYLDRDATVAAERDLLDKVDIVFAVNEPLAATKRAFVPATFVSPHGVDRELFATALECPIHEALAAIPGPRIGFVGTLRDWVDFELVAHIARARPQWSIVMVGRRFPDSPTTALEGLPNLHLIDPQPHGALPSLFAGFDVGIIPYRAQTRMTYVNPLKLREYLAGGLPVVSTPLGEAARYPGMCEVAHDRDAFVTAIERALTRNSKAERIARSEAMIQETWRARVELVSRKIDEVENGPPLSERVPFLVTGAAGSLGRAVVQRLRDQGHRVRAFTRQPPTEIAGIAGLSGLEYVVGDLGDAETVDRAVKGAEVVIHVGATMRGDWAAHESGTVNGTRNVIDACTKYKTRQLVHISSLSVIDLAGAADGVVDESTPLEPRAAERGFYTQAKLAAEREVSAAAARGLPCAILRPGQIFGGGIPALTGAVARKVAGQWVVLGDAQLELPLVYIDDVVDAIIATVEKQLVAGEIIQLVDPTSLTQAEVLGDHGRISIPRGVVFALGKLSELPMKLLGRTSPIAAYRLESAMSRVHYRSDRARQLLGWEPRVGVRNGLRR